MATQNKRPVTISELAEFILGRPAVNGADFEEASLPMIGGCEVCGATIAAYNACPSKTGYLRCARECIGDLGWYTVEEAEMGVFDDDDDDDEPCPSYHEWFPWPSED